MAGEFLFIDFCFVDIPFVRALVEKVLLVSASVVSLKAEVVVAAVEASAGSLGALPVAESLLSLVALDEQASSSERLFAS